MLLVQTKRTDDGNGDQGTVPVFLVQYCIIRKINLSILLQYTKPFSSTIL